jgi:hypothetical protein
MAPQERCRISGSAEHAAEPIYESFIDSGGGYLGHAPDSGQRAVTRGGTTYTMKTAAGTVASDRAYLAGMIPSCFMRSRIAAISGARGRSI